MLSAFQARKVRLAATPGVQESTASSLTTASPDFRIPAPDFTPRRTSRKRKPELVTTDETGQPHRRKKADDRVEGKVRYFDAPVGVSEPDLHSLTDEDISLSDQENLPQSHAQPQRAWSPSQPLLDSSDEEMETEGGVQHTNASIETFATTTFSAELDVNTFRLTPKECFALISLEELATAIILPVHSSITLTGVYQLTVLQGAVMLMGVSLTSSDISHVIFSPKLSPLPRIESLGNTDPAPPLISNVPDRLRPWISSDHAVILIRAHFTGIEGLGYVVRTFENMFQSSQPKSSIVDLGIPGVQVHKWTQEERNLEGFVLPKAWDQGCSSLLDVYSHTDGDNSTVLRPIVCQITGPKSSGKSTFARMLLNRLATRYSQVAIIDCDPGQSEFSPSGMVALTVISKPLFGPPFTHPTTPHAAHFIGSPTPQNSPTLYLNAIQALVQTYQQDLEFPTTPPTVDSRITEVVPLVVNTMGWTKGLGANLNKKIEDLVGPSDVFEFENLNHNSNFGSFPPTPNPERHRRHLPPAQTFTSTSHTPAELRALSLLSYFHAVRLPVPSDHQATLLWETETPLCAKVPYDVFTPVAFDKIILATPGMEDVVASEIQSVLNGAVVALVESRDEGVVASDRPPGGSGCLDSLYEQGTPPPSPFSSNCLGLALIRSLSATRMQMITPVPPALLGRCRILVKGEIEIPIWGMLDFRAENDDDVAGVEKSKVPYLRWGKTEGLGGGKRRFRRNLMRKSQS
ncbi:hypothetical protein BDM02DRAFT_3183440 [Thelephora ganbajun]|uniref:Uncharacterized protein n=1 Tax=Thelephora ganbajun TaxID=370292 RepID=A0ACB6ZT98_THEGA|nr:hypothetical protein BDM02DRAFT_3183440 [Thelephora ganbajun]